uniref:BTB domain-containing protein n=1 Tax=Ditylenchus dipsaci TaxID=166011 RepID=A0A915EDE3_9BILA
MLGNDLANLLMDEETSDLEAPIFGRKNKTMCDRYNLYDPYNLLNRFDPNIRNRNRHFPHLLNGNSNLHSQTFQQAYQLRRFVREKNWATIYHLLMDEETSDVVLVVEGFHFYVHKLILAARSSYFRTEKEIPLIDVSLPCFKRILVYIYTGDIAFASEDLESIVELVGLANKYELKCLLSELSDHMDAILNHSNFSFIYSVADLFSLIELKSKCIHFLCKNKKEY